MKKRFRWALLGLALAVHAASASAESQKLAVVYTAASDVLPVLVAKDEGIFEKNQLDVTLTRAQVTPNIIPVLVSGSAQIGMSTPPHLLQGAENGLELLVVSGGSRVSADNPTISLVVRSDLRVAKPGDLKGMRIGVPGLMGMVDMVLRRWLQQNEIPLDSVKLVEVSIPQMNDLLAGHQVDALTAIEPMRTRAVQSGAGYIAAEFYSDVNPDTIGVFWLAMRKWAEENPDAVHRFRASLDEAIAAIAKDPPMARAVEMKYLSLNAPKLPEYRTTVTVEDLAFFAKLLTDFGLLQTPPDLGHMLDIR
jgi:NitT/TauT family transport system substrate-binding protein